MATDLGRDLNEVFEYLEVPPAAYNLKTVLRASHRMKNQNVP